MTETTELDPQRRYLVPVARIHLPDEPDLVHLSLYEWLPRWEHWATGLALCGASTEQGALPDGTEVTCPDCEQYRPKYQAALDRQSPEAIRTPEPGGVQESLRAQVRAAVRASGLKQTWIAGRLGVSEKHLSHLLTGRVPLSLEWAERIVALCGKRVRVVVEGVAGVDR